MKLELQEQKTKNGIPPSLNHQDRETICHRPVEPSYSPREHERTEEMLKTHGQPPVNYK